jgi:hypothetical protein
MLTSGAWANVETWAMPPAMVAVDTLPSSSAPPNSKTMAIWVCAHRHVCNCQWQVDYRCHVKPKLQLLLWAGVPVQVSYQHCLSQGQGL